DHYSLYGEFTGVRSARKHLGWYAQALPLPAGAASVFRSHINTLTTAQAQLDCVRENFDAWAAARPEQKMTREDNWKLAA
ncbi:MAG: tRNA dihydrouridine synthase DusB, partial [Rhodoferax sp.]